MSKIFKAFTLIELLVVIAIIGILSGLIVVSMSGVTEKANVAKSQVFANSLKNSLMLNLVSEWKFDSITDYTVDGGGNKIVGNINGNIVDSWGAAGYSHGTASGGPILKEEKDCVVGKCLYFDGNNDCVVVGDDAFLKLGLNSFTIGFWGKLDFIDVEGQHANVIIGKRNGGWADPTYAGYEINTSNPGNTMIAWIADGTNLYTKNIAIDKTKFQFYVFVLSRAEKLLKGYLNGVKYGSDVSVGSSFGSVVNTLSFDLMRRSGGGYNMRGYLDDVHIYNVEMSAFQIKEQYYIGLNKLLINGSIDKEEYLSRINEIAIK